MKRRVFLTSTGLVLAPLSVRAQTPPPLIGFLHGGEASSPSSARVLGLLRKGFGDTGAVEGRDYLFDVRYAAGDYTRFPALARELAQAGARVILANTVPGVRAAQALEPAVPVVIAAVLDPVGNGLIDSLARPGRHTTGVGLLNADLTIKLLELQRAVLPKARTIAALYNPASPANVAALQRLQAGAGSAGFTAVPVPLKLPEDLDAVFAALADRAPDSLQILQDTGTLDLSGRITAQALHLKLPTFAESAIVPANGGLLSYGPQFPPLFYKAAALALRIARGANPADMPVEQPTLFEMVINLKTAKALGLEIAPVLLAQADTVIE